MALNAGSLNRRITIQTVTTAPDSIYGGPVETTATLATRWARRRTLSMQEKVAAGFEIGTVLMEYAFRWDATLDDALDAADSMVDEGTTYDIRGVSEDDGYHVELKVIAEAKR